MAYNYLAIGDRELTGKIGRILAAGDLNIYDAEVKKLYTAGDLDILNSYVKKLRAAGDIKAVNCNFSDFKAAGDIKIKGACKVDTFVSVGDVCADYLECKVLRNHTKQGKKIRNKYPYIVTYKGSFKATTFESFYPIKLNFEYEFNNIISNAELYCDSFVECERFYSFSTAALEGINAEYIYIIPNSNFKVNVITGTNINISGSWRLDKSFKIIPKTIPFYFYSDLLKKLPSVMTVKEIEGDNIILDHVKAESVCGINVTIGDMCVIDKVEYKSGLKLSDKAVVGEVVKL